jgi:hypothetical protein
MILFLKKDIIQKHIHFYIQKINTLVGGGEGWK